MGHFRDVRIEEVLYMDWHVAMALFTAFLFGFGIGRTAGESAAWEEMDKRESDERSG